LLPPSWQPWIAHLVSSSFAVVGENYHCDFIASALAARLLIGLNLSLNVTRDLGQSDR
jgi:hypothetical protein